MLPRVGLNIAPLPAHLMLAAGRRAEELGFESLWLGEHLAVPVAAESEYPAGGGAQPFTVTTAWLDPMLVLSHVAAATSTIRLGVGIYIAPLRSPVITAKAFTTLDHLCGGRLEFAWGVGWMREEFDLAGADFTTRGRRMDEILDIFEVLFSDESFPSYGGTYYSFPPIGFYPKPVVGPRRSRIVGGGYSEAAFRRSARCDGWYGHLDRLDTSPPRQGICSPEVAREFTHRFRTIRRERGGNPEDFEISGAVRGLASRDELHDLGEAGIDRVVVNPWAHRGEPEVGSATSFEPAEEYAADIGLRPVLTHDVCRPNDEEPKWTVTSGQA
ncbi:TIGR03619 family F420-dependent LLM class oxidoreductase [Actinophytocola sp.]|uniref:TIGR03619 family F420-dependent LLM class oxidoreductase n=1 Tax=Actinophytocola sp. TaxID=1872138 RepID=UPI003D6B3C97